jgi:hypothetical protein
MYYKLGEVEKARAAAKTLVKLFREKLVWFSTFSADEFDIIFEEFDMTFRYFYRGVIDQVIENEEDPEFVKKLQDEFNNTLILFEHIMPQDEGK